MHVTHMKIANMKIQNIVIHLYIFIFIFVKDVVPSYQEEVSFSSKIPDNICGTFSLIFNFTGIFLDIERQETEADRSFSSSVHVRN